MKEIPSFDIELSQAIDYIMSSPLARKAFSNPPFPQYTNILRLLIQSVDRLADNCHMPEFTNHALPHICSIVRRASEWAVDDGWLEELSEQEVSYLLLALVIHDIGMLSQDAHDLPEEDKQLHMKGFSDISNWVRRTHVVRLQGLVLRLLQEELKEDVKKQNESVVSEQKILLKDHMLVLIGMAASHQCWEWEPEFISNQDSISKVGLDEERVAALNAVIAVCDLLDEDSNRCDTITLIKYRHGTMENFAHWIRHALTVEVDGVKNHTVTVNFRKLVPSNSRHEKIYRALRNHYRLVKLYNNRLEKINAEIEHLIFNPPDGIPEKSDEISEELSRIWVNLPEFKNHIVEQILSTFMQEALNKECGNAKMRQRLDKLGLETLDLTEESLFLNPPTTYFSDERILFGKGEFKELLNYIKEQVDTAYLDGNIGKLRHLCFIALESWKTTVSLNDMYWVFIYITVFQKYGNEMENFEFEYENSLLPKQIGKNYEKIIMEGEYQPLLDVLLLLLEPITGEQWYEKYKEHIKKYSYYNLKDDIATELLLETIVGLLWYYDQDGSVWLEVSDFLCGQLSSILKQKLSDYVKQIKELHMIINHIDDKSMIMIRANCSDSVEKAWIDFWNGDWENQELNIPDLCRMGNHDRDYMESIQGYLNLVRWNIQHQHNMLEYERRNSEKRQNFAEINSNKEIQKSINGDGQKEEQECGNLEKIEVSISKSNDSETDMREFTKREINIGKYRYNRIIMEQPLPIFWEQRKSIIDSMIAECRRQKHNSQNLRIRVIRLIAIHTLDALRYWDLWQYIDGIRSQTVFDFLNGTYYDKYGKYCGDKQALRDCFINYIKGLDSKGLNKDEQKMAARVLLRYEPEELDTIIHFITEKSIPLQWKFALNVVETFAETFSMKQRKRLIDWLIKYHEFYQKQNTYFNTTQYEFLYYWCKDMEKEDWKKLKDIIDTIFLSQSNMMTNSKLVVAVFEYAPWEWGIQYLNKMKTFPNNVRKSYDFYSAIITMSKRIDRKPALQTDQSENSDQKNKDNWANLEELKEIVEWLLEDINQQINTVSEEGNKDEVSRDELICMKLHYEELEKLIGIDKLDQLEAVDLTMIEQILEQMEQEIENRKGLSGYDSTFMNPVKDAFINKNWNVEDEIREQQIIDRIFSTMEQYKESMSALFFVDFCHLFLWIENSCSNHIRSHINNIVIENMVREDFFGAQKKKERVWDGPYQLFRFDDGSNNQYEVMVTLLLVNGMIVLKSEERTEAIKYITRALRVDEPVIYNYATIMFSYFFLIESQSCEKKQNGDVITSLAWGGLQFILGRLVADSRRVDREEADEIKKWVQKALDTMAESEKWFGTDGFLVCAKKNKEYIEWIEAMDCRLLKK